MFGSLSPAQKQDNHEASEAQAFGPLTGTNSFSGAGRGQTVNHMDECVSVHVHVRVCECACVLQNKDILYCFFKDPNLPCGRSYRPIRNGIHLFITSIVLFFGGLWRRGMEKRDAINFLYLSPSFVSSSKKPPHANELSSLQGKRGLMDKCCRQEHFSIIL